MALRSKLSILFPFCRLLLTWSKFEKERNFATYIWLPLLSLACLGSLQFFFSQIISGVVWLLLCKFVLHSFPAWATGSIQLESHRLYQNHSMTLYYGGLIEHGVIFLKYKKLNHGIMGRRHHLACSYCLNFTAF